MQEKKKNPLKWWWNVMHCQCLCSLLSLINASFLDVFCRLGWLCICWLHYFLRLSAIKYASLKNKNKMMVNSLWQNFTTLRIKMRQWLSLTQPLMSTSQYFNTTIHNNDGITIKWFSWVETQQWVNTSVLDMCLLNIQRLQLPCPSRSFIHSNSKCCKSEWRQRLVQACFY